MRSHRPDWRKAGLAAASVTINTALIAALAYTTLGIRNRKSSVQPPPIYLDIEPRPLLPDERPRPPVVSPPVAKPNVARSASSAPSSARAPQAQVPLLVQDRPAPLRPRLAVPAPEDALPPPDIWRVDPANREAAMARSLRQGVIGCASPERLSEVERRNCRDDFSRRAAAAPPIKGTGNRERDTEFARQGARRLQQWEAQRRPLSGGVGVVGPADCIGSNFGTGCAGAHLDPSFAPDSSRNIRTRRDGPPASGVPMVPGATGPGREPQ